MPNQPPIALPSTSPGSTAERRRGGERRRLTWRTVRSGLTHARRRGERRAPRPGSLIWCDWYHPWLLFLAAGIMLMTSFDAFFTLRLLERGAVEINPLMRVLIEASTFGFVSVKMLLTGIGLVLLVCLSQVRLFQVLRTGIVMTACFCGYACLMCYQIVALMAA